MITLKLMADYDCWPLWWYAGTDAIGNVDPHTLGLTDATLGRLQAWSERYNSYLDREDPGHSPDPTPAEQEAFEQEGIAIWRVLQHELRGRYQIVYYSERFKQIRT